MSLLKTLQNNLTRTSLPLFSKESAVARYLINEIVIGEESAGNRKSHFELYLDAMNLCGADTSQINDFIKELQYSRDLDKAFIASNAPAAVREFVNCTFDVIGTNKPHIQSAVFTFGREDLIPQMFLSIIFDLSKKFPGSISIFKYYLERHIEVDGDHHCHLALKMTTEPFGTNEQHSIDAQHAVIASLQKRI